MATVYTQQGEYSGQRLQMYLNCLLNRAEQQRLRRFF